MGISSLISMPFSLLSSVFISFVKCRSKTCFIYKIEKFFFRFDEELNRKEAS